MPCLALVLELHHPLPGPGEVAGPDWAASGIAVDWPLLRALDAFAERPGEASITLAVSPSWTALAADPRARALQRRELERKVQAGEADRGLLRFFATAGDGDPLRLLRRWNASGAIDVIPTTATHTWLPSVAAEPILARAQVGLAAMDHAHRFEVRPSGVWLPFLGYAPGLETTMAANGLRFFGVAADVFLRGTVLPPARTLAPMVTPAGVAAFAVPPPPAAEAVDLAMGYGRDRRYADPKQAPIAADDHAEHFLGRWSVRASEAPPGGEVPDEPVSVASFSAHELARAWPSGGADAWLGSVLDGLASGESGRASSLDRYLARNPIGTLGRPGVSVGGVLAARPGGSDLFDRCRAASDLLTFAVEKRRALDESEREAVAEMARRLLRAQQVDWSYPVAGGIDPETGLRRASHHLARFHELAGSLMAGRLDRGRLARMRRGPSFLPDLDLDVLAAG
ncbi:1,4-alpha-glucan branching protein domain-containing protein [Paludisphaera soli]|uniref:1,4-alpha-glucan branching protein domain-containing protein n=1 Tax=Paludisphaera soli TaxID=2712865 RepID=UPI0013EC02C7|nr:1,4-alpha-glucan branching protein domain-containing protein [Paludisphaera soli]